MGFLEFFFLPQKQPGVKISEKFWRPRKSGWPRTTLGCIVAQCSVTPASVARHLLRGSLTCDTPRSSRTKKWPYVRERKNIHTHKHKQVCGIVPGLGVWQNFVHVFSSGHSMQGRKPPKIPGQSRENFVYFFSLCLRSPRPATEAPNAGP